jgi:hypothetical protein
MINYNFVNRFFLRRYNRFPKDKSDVFLAFSSLIIFLLLDAYLILFFLPKTITSWSNSKSLLYHVGGAALFVVMCMLVSHLLSFVQTTFYRRKEAELQVGDKVFCNYQELSFEGLIELINQKPIGIEYPIYIIKDKNGKRHKVPLNGMMLDLKNITNYVVKK